MLNGTVNALRQFQRSIRVYASGAADQKTLDALGAPMETAEPAVTASPAGEAAAPENSPEPTPTPEG